jgi:hypothetical protein
MDFASPGRAAALSPPARGLFAAAGGGTPALLRLPQLSGGVGESGAGVGASGAASPRGFTAWRAATPGGAGGGAGAPAWTDWWAAPPGALLRSASAWSLGDGLLLGGGGARAPAFVAAADVSARALRPRAAADGSDDDDAAAYWARMSSASAQARAARGAPARRPARCTRCPDAVFACAGGMPGLTRARPPPRRALRAGAGQHVRRLGARAAARQRLRPRAAAQQCSRVFS